jgi:hypothetical protein
VTLHSIAVKKFEIATTPNEFRSSAGRKTCDPDHRRTGEEAGSSVNQLEQARCFAAIPLTKFLPECNLNSVAHKFNILVLLLDVSVSQGTQAYAIARSRIGPPSPTLGGGKMRQQKSAAATGRRAADFRPS